MPSLLDAIREKYCGSVTDTGESNAEGAASNDGLIFQFVSFKRNETNYVEACNNRIPSIMVLNNYKITEIGDEQEMQDICKDTCELDLAHNELSDWNEIHKLLGLTERLKFLNLSFNNLCEPMPTPTIFQDADFAAIPICSTLSTLILINTNISWASIWALIHNMRQLEELHLSKNNFTSVEVGPNVADESDDGACVFTNLKRFVFNENPIEDWNDVNKIGKCFPCLEHLGLAETLVNSIDAESHEYFPKLKSLSVASTRINEMITVTQLRKFPSLSELRIHGNTLFSDLSSHERRQLIVALLPNITKLNGTVISESERDISERAFIRYFDQLHLEGDKPERYEELSKVHGKLDPLVNLDLKPATKVKLWFVLEGKRLLKEVKVNQTTSELKIFARKLYNLDSQRFRLFFQNTALIEGYGGEEMRFPQKYLYSYNPVDNDEIILVPFATTANTKPGPGTSTDKKYQPFGFQQSINEDQDE